MQQIPWSAGLLALARRFGDAVAVRDTRSTLSFNALAGRAHAMAAALAARGIRAGEPVALSLPNGTDVVWASYGITLHGAAEAPMSPSLTADEVAWITGLARCRHVVTEEARRPFFEALGKEVLAIEDIAVGSAPSAACAGASAEAWGKIVGTSGTTGKPKAVVYTHQRRWFGHELLKSALPFVPQAGDRILMVTPFPHGASYLSYAWLDFGGEVILLDGLRREESAPVLHEGVAAVFAPPTVINKLAELFPEDRFAGVRCVFTGTQTLTEATYRRAERMFGPVVRVTYGKTECVNPITVLAPAETTAHFAGEATPEGACLGRPADGVELEIRNGEIWLRARHMSNGYIDPSGFHEWEGGWHATGDLGWLDAHGRLWLSGRLADVIKSGGYKVQPEEIEATLAGVPQCGQIVIASLPSDYWGEIIVAATEGTTGDWIGAAQARAESLSRHKRPRAYLALPSLPRNPQGKISRREVRAEILRRYALEDGPHPALVARG